MALLEEGVEWTNTQINPDDAQFLATRAFQVIEICRFLRLPPHKLGDLTNANYSNVEAMNLRLPEMTCHLRPWCIRIEECLNLKLLSDEEIRAGFYTRHDMRALLRASIKDRADYYTKLFALGMSANEIRELEDMNPIAEEEGGDRRFRPALMIGLDSEDAQADAIDPAKPHTAAPKQARATWRRSSLPVGRNGAVFAAKNGHFTHENGEI